MYCDVLREATNEWGNFHLKQPFGIFSEQGYRLGSAEEPCSEKMPKGCFRWKLPHSLVASRNTSQYICLQLFAVFTRNELQSIATGMKQSK
jgi:hypothetical protein